MIKYHPLQALKVDLSQVDIPSYHVLIIPETRDVLFGYRSFYLMHDERDFAKYMFTCFVEDDENAVEIATKNAPSYLPEALHDTEIIYCKDCHWGYSVTVYDKTIWRCGKPSHNTEEYGFCHRAERKQKCQS